MKRHEPVGPMSLLLLGLAAAMPIACGGAPGEDSSAGPVSTVTTEGDVTTVVNESGSAWGGTARLVEEASIGVDEGEEPYMFGRPGGVHVFEERIYVIDEQVPAVRVFDFDGIHLFSFGQEGQGPGEFQRPYSIGGSADGRIFVGDRRNGRINVYSADGEYLADYPLGRVQCCIRPMVVTADGVPFYHTFKVELAQAGVDQDVHPMEAHDEDGATGELIGPPHVEVPRETFTFQGREMSTRFSPTVVWKVAPNGALIFGTSDRYRFEVRHRRGATLVVERAWEPVPVDADEREWARLHTIASLRRSDPEWSWDGAQIPDSKPAFEDLIAGHAGEIWVVRPGLGIKDPECDDKHSPNDWPYHSEHWRCWRDQPIIDAFDGEGLYLGDVEVPEGIVLNSIAPPYIRGDTVVAALYEPDGVIRVKRYRLTPPDAGEAR